jgi:PAS domain S-box-containing protein
MEDGNHIISEWKQFLQVIGLPAMIVDGSHRILYVNSALEIASGISEADLSGKACHEVFHLSTDAPADCPLVKCRDSLTHETCRMHTQFSGRTYVISCTPIDHSDPQYFLHTSTDITDLIDTLNGSAMP